MSVTSAADIAADNGRNGVSGWASGDGDVNVAATGGTIRAANTFGRGVFGSHTGTGDVSVTSAADIAIGGQAAHGVMGWISNENSNGAVAIDVSGGTIRTTSTANADIYGSAGNGWSGEPDGINERANSLGVLGWTQGLGAVTVRSRADIHTAGASSEGVAGHISNAGNAAAMTVDVGRSTITTAGDLSVGVAALHSGTGRVTLTSAADIATGGQAAQGVFGVITNAQSTGTLTIGARGTIRTASTAANDLHAGTFANAIGLRPPESLAPPDGRGDPTNADGILGLQEGLGRLSVTSSADITTAGANSDGIEGWISNTRNERPLSVRTSGGTITTAGHRAHGAYARHDGSGGAASVAAVSGTIRTSGTFAKGAFGFHTGTGDVSVASAADITTGGQVAHGVMGWIINENSNGAVTVDVSGGIIRTTSTARADVYGSAGNGWSGGPDGTNDFTDSLGVLGWTQGLGAVTVRSEADIHTAGASSEGVVGHISNARNAAALSIGAGGAIATTGDLASGVFGHHSGTGAVTLSSDADITTSGQTAQGVSGTITNARSSGNLTISAGGTIRTTSTATADLHTGSLADAFGLQPAALLAPPDGRDDPTNANGILGLQEGLGALSVTSSANIATAGIESDGIESWISNAGNDQSLSVQADGGTIATSGDRSHGIYARHDGSSDAVNVHSSAEIVTRGAGSHGIYARVDAGAGPINIQVRGGSIQASGAGSHGVLAHYAGSDATSITISEGASVAARGDGASAVLARGGAIDAATGKRRQTIIVNGRVAASAGADGVRTDGGTVVIGPNGIIEALDSESTAIVSTAASPADTTIVLKPGAPLDTRLQGGITNIPKSGIIIESRDGGMRSLQGVFMARSAVYEVLPQTLLDFPGPRQQTTASAQRGLWAHMAYADGKRDAGHSSTAAEFDHRRWVFEAGADLAEWEVGGGMLRAGLSAHVLDGDADVSSSAGSGNIETQGRGLGLYAVFRSESDLYTNAWLRFTRFESDLDFPDAEPPIENVDADAYSFAAEIGLALQEWSGKILSARARASYTNVDIDAFTDRTSLTRMNSSDADSFKVGAGLVLRRPGGIYASLDLEHEFDGDTEVAGEGDVLKRRPRDTWGRAAVGGKYEWGNGRYELSGALNYAASLTGSSNDFSGNINLRCNF